MTNYNHIGGNCFTLKILCPEIKEIFIKQQLELNPYLKKLASPEKIHLGLKYLGYEKNYTNEFMIGLIPDISKIVNRHLPMNLKLTGLGRFIDSPEQMSSPVIFLKVKLTKELRELHNELNKILKERVDTFNFAEGEDYTPHITLGNGKEEFVSELKEIVGGSKFVNPVNFVVNKFAMRLKEGKTQIIK